MDVTPPGRPTRQVGRPEGGAHRSSVVPLGRDHGQGLHKGRHIFHRCFSCRSWGVDCWKSRWRSHGRCGGYGFGFSVAGHGLILVMGCWWNQWRLLGIDGNKVWSLGFLKRRRRVRDSFSHREMPSCLAELDSRWVKEAVTRSWASLGLAQIRSTTPACAGQLVGLCV